MPTRLPAEILSARITWPDNATVLVEADVKDGKPGATFVPVPLTDALRTALGAVRAAIAAALSTADPAPDPAPEPEPQPPPDIDVDPDGDDWTDAPPLPAGAERVELFDPQQDVAKVAARLKPGDQLLLRRNHIYRPSAPVVVKPGMYIGTFGPKDLPRPWVRAKADGFVLNGAHGATIRGLDIRPVAGIPGDPEYRHGWGGTDGDPVRGVQFTGPCNDVTLEDLDVRGFEDNVSCFQAKGLSRNLVFRNLTLAYALSKRHYTGHGILAAGYDGLLIDGCRLLYNGWFPGVRAQGIHCHGLYGSAEHGAKNLTVRNTLTVGNASFGLQCRVPASRILGCLSVDDALAFLVNGAGRAEVSDCGMVAGHYTVVDGRHGQQMVEWCAESGLFARNVFVGGPPPQLARDPKAGDIGMQDALSPVTVHRRPPKKGQEWQWQGRIHCEAANNLFCGVNGLTDPPRAQDRKPRIVTDVTEVIRWGGQKDTGVVRENNKVRADKPALPWVDAFVKDALAGRVDAARGLELLRQAAGA